MTNEGQAVTHKVPTSSFSKKKATTESSTRKKLYGFGVYVNEKIYVSISNIGYTSFYGKGCMLFWFHNGLLRLCQLTWLHAYFQL